jgi:hypothetical protein
MLEENLVLCGIGIAGKTPDGVSTGTWRGASIQLRDADNDGHKLRIDVIVRNMVMAATQNTAGKELHRA